MKKEESKKDFRTKSNWCKLGLLLSGAFTPAYFIDQRTKDDPEEPERRCLHSEDYKNCLHEW